MAQKFNIILDQGSYFEATVELKNSENNPVDLTGYTFFSGVRYNYDRPIILEFDITTIEPQSGVLYFSLASSETLDTPPNQYIYDIYLFNGTEYFRILEGNLKITNRVTKYESIQN